MYLPIYLQSVWWYKFPELKNKDIIAIFIKECRNDDGGYGNCKNAKSYLENVFYAIVTYSLVDRLDCVTPQTFDYIDSCKCDDGGYGEPFSNRSNIFNTFYAVISLKKLNRISCDLQIEVARYIDSLINNNQIFDKHIGILNTTTIYWVASIMKCISYNNTKVKAWIIDFCAKCYDTSKGLFAPFPNGIPSIQSTFECLSLLKLYSSLNVIDTEEVYISIMNLKRDSMYIDSLTKKATLSSTMWAIESLSILNRINKFEQSNVFNLIAFVFEKKFTLYDLFCATSMLVSIFYEPGNVNMSRSLTIKESGHSLLMQEIKNLSNKLFCSGFDPTSYDYLNKIKRQKKTIELYENTFYQIILDFNSNHIYEIEYNSRLESVASLTVPMSRVVNECINKNIIIANRIKLMGVFDSNSNLIHSRIEDSIISDFCQKSNIYQYTTLIGNDATLDKISAVIKNGQDIFYISGHCFDGKILLFNTIIDISSLIQMLIEAHCLIIFINCCDTYVYIKNFFRLHPEICENINIICTLDDVNDEQASYFATSFFYYLELGFPISEAVRLSKIDLYLMCNGLGNTWLNYVLFGNPFTFIVNDE